MRRELLVWLRSTTLAALYADLSGAADCPEDDRFLEDVEDALIRKVGCDEAAALVAAAAGRTTTEPTEDER